MVIERETDHCGVGTSVANVEGSWHSGHECPVKEKHRRRVRVRSCDKTQLCPREDRNFSPMAPCISGAVQPICRTPMPGWDSPQTLTCSRVARVIRRACFGSHPLLPWLFTSTVTSTVIGLLIPFKPQFTYL